MRWRRRREHAALRFARRFGRTGEGLQQQRPVAEGAAAIGAEAPMLRDEAGFTGLKLRMGRERLRDDIAALEAARKSVGDDIKFMVDFNQGLNLGEALERCHAIATGACLDRGADRLRQLSAASPARR